MEIEEFDADAYRVLCRNITDFEAHLKTLEEAKRVFETKVFKNLDVGNTLQIEEFQFKVTEGKRGLYPAKGFHLVWDEKLQPVKEIDEEQYHYLRAFIKEEMTYKGPTLGELEKMMPNDQWVRNNWDVIKEVFGYTPGKRTEKVKVLDIPRVDPREPEGHYHSTEVAGMKHREDVPWGAFVEGEELKLEREPENEADKYAIKVFYKNHFVGYIPKEIAQDLALLMDDGKMLFSGRIEKINGIKLEIEIIYRKVQGA